MMHLPAEVLEQVFVLLTSNRDRNSVSLVCKYWCKVEGGCRFRVLVKNFYALGPFRVLARFPKLTALSLKGKPRFHDLELVNLRGFALPWIEFLGKNCPWLKELRLKRMVVSDQSLVLISSSFQEFESLSLIGCGGFSSHGLAAIASNCRFLKELVLLENEIEEDTDNLVDDGIGDGISEWLSCFPENCSSLVSLNFACMRGEVNLEALEKLVARCPNLRSLRLNSQVPISTLEKILRKAPQLEDLGIGCYSTDWRTYFTLLHAALKCKSIRSLSGFMFVSPQCLPAIYPICSNLISLNLSKAVHVQAPHLSRLLHNCKKLQNLWILDCIGDKGLEVVASSCRNLQALRIFPFGGYNAGNASLTEEGLITISMSCPQLHSLVYCCHRTTNAALISIARNCPNITNFRLCINDPTKPDHMTSQPLDEGFGAIVQSCKGLRRLSLSGHVSDRVFLYIGMYAEQLENLSILSSGEGNKGLLYVLNGCKNLKKMEMKDSSFVDSALMAEMVKHEKIRCLWVSSSKTSVEICRALSLQVPTMNVEIIKGKNKVNDDDCLEVEKLYLYRNLDGHRRGLPDSLTL